MTLQKIFEDCLNLDSCEKRIEQENYIELALRREGISKYICSLDATFGSPAKPEGARPSRRLSSAAKKNMEESGKIRRYISAMTWEKNLWPCSGPGRTASMQLRSLEPC